MPVTADFNSARVCITHYEAVEAGGDPDWLPERDDIFVHQVPRLEFDKIVAKETELISSYLWIKRIEFSGFNAITFFCTEPPSADEEYDSDTPHALKHSGFSRPSSTAP